MLNTLPGMVATAYHCKVGKISCVFSVIVIKETPGIGIPFELETSLEGQMKTVPPTTGLEKTMEERELSGGRIETTLVPTVTSVVSKSYS